MDRLVVRDAGKASDDGNRGFRVEMVGSLDGEG
jgi:hypothetical protein